MIPSPKKHTRIGLSKKIRFEIFKRDSFTCQYCGGKAPTSILHVDHIHPVSLGGTNAVLNLITSCSECNLGKSARKLSSTDVVEKAQLQAAQLQERRNQIEMMATWQCELASLDPEIDAANAVFPKMAGGKLTDEGKRKCRLLIRKYSLQHVMQSIAIAYDSYPREEAFNRIEGICRGQKLQRDNPQLANVNRILYGIGRTLGRDSVRFRLCRSLIERHMESGKDPILLMRSAERGSRSWYTFYNSLMELSK